MCEISCVIWPVIQLSLPQWPQLGVVKQPCRISCRWMSVCRSLMVLHYSHSALHWSGEAGTFLPYRVSVQRHQAFNGFSNNTSLKADTALGKRVTTRSRRLPTPSGTPQRISPPTHPKTPTPPHQLSFLSRPLTEVSSHHLQTKLTL